ncbi:MAG: V-type ATPase subunit [Nanoarchaeota archaeon]
MINATNLTGLLLNSSAVNGTAVNSTAHLAQMINPILFSVGLPLLLLIIIAMFVMRTVTPVTPFLYANARIHARSNKMVSDQLLIELTDGKSLKEFSSMLKETLFKEELEKTDDQLRSIHTALENSFMESIIELGELSPEKSRNLLNSYFLFMEAKLLKIIYRAKLTKSEVPDCLVHPVGNIDKNVLKHLLDAETIADISVVMVQTIYSEVFERKYSTLEEFEVSLDEYVLNKIVHIVKKTKMYDGEFIINIINLKIDLLNIMALLKFRIRNVSKDIQKKMLVNNKTELCSRFENLINAEKLKDFVEEFKGTDYYAAMNVAYEKHNKDKSLVHFENELYKMFKKNVVSNDLLHTLGPYPIFSHLIKMELILRNLFVISRGIDAGFASEKIKEMIV